MQSHHIFRIIGSIFMICCTANVEAQEWFNRSETWHYSYEWSCDDEYYTGHREIEVCQDTVVNSIACKKFCVTTTFWADSNCEPDQAIIRTFSVIGHEDGGIVYFQYFDSDSTFFFQPIYNFNLTEGDTLTFFAYWGCSTRRYVIDSTGTELIHGIELKFQDAQWVYANNALGEKFRIYERIGQTTLDRGSLFLVASISCFALAIPSRKFRCFSDNQIDQYSVTEQACDYISISTATHEINSSLQIYPNPASGFVYIRSSNVIIERVVLYNLSGQAVESQTSSGYNVKIDLYALPAAIYVVEIRLSDGIRLIEKVVVN